jgi:hypothetical protein
VPKRVADRVATGVAEQEQVKPDIGIQDPRGA